MLNPQVFYQLNLFLGFNLKAIKKKGVFVPLYGQLNVQARLQSIYCDFYACHNLYNTLSTK